MNTDKYLNYRTGPLKQMERAMEDAGNRSTVIDKLNMINNNTKTPLQVQGVFTSTYPAIFTIRENDQQKDMELWVKETRVGYDTPIPYLILNEGKVLQTIIKDMFKNNKSPHFVYPVTQILTNDTQGTESHISIYTLTEYFPHPSFSEYVSRYDVRDTSSKFGLITAVFQIMYNLSVMQNLHLRHNDLHPRNIKINPNQLFLSTYILDQKSAYTIPSTCFVAFVGWERSLVNKDNYTSIPIPERIVNISEGRVEDAWETWNPYADMATVWTTLMEMMGKKSDMLEILFGKDPTIREDLERLIRAKNPQSFIALREEMGDDNDFLERCLPTNLTRRFAGQFFNTISPQGESGIVFSAI